MGIMSRLKAFEEKIESQRRKKVKLKYKFYDDMDGTIKVEKLIGDELVDAWDKIPLDISAILEKCNQTSGGYKAELDFSNLSRESIAKLKEKKKR